MKSRNEDLKIQKIVSIRHLISDDNYCGEQIIFLTTWLTKKGMNKITFVYMPLWDGDLSFYQFNNSKYKVTYGKRTD